MHNNALAYLLKSALWVTTFIWMCLPVAGADNSQTLDVGGNTVIISTDSEFNFVQGSDFASIEKEVMVPPQNELLAAFLEQNELGTARATGFSRVSRYGLVQIMKKFAAKPLSNAEFQQHLVPVLFGIQPRLPSTAEKISAIITERTSVPTSVNIVPIGEMDSGADFFSLLLLLRAKADSSATDKVKLGSASVLVLNSRLVFIYLFTNYNDEWDVTWLRAKTFSTILATRAANQ